MNSGGSLDKSLNKLLNRNLTKLYLFSFAQCFLVIIPVIIPFWQAKGLTIQEIFILQGIFGAALIVFDAPAGYLADLFGRKNALVIGSFISAVGFQILWFGETFADWVIYELIIGLGLSLQSGCDVAILYNTLDKMSLKERTASFLGRRLTAQTLGDGFSALLGGFLVAYSLNYPAYATAAVAWVPFLVALTLKEPDGPKLCRTSHIENFKSIGKALFGHSKLLTLVILSFIFYGFATYAAVWSLQPYWKSRGLSVEMFGYLWAINSFLVAIVARYAHAIETKIGSTISILVIAILPIVGYLGMGYVPGLAGLWFSIAFPVCRGLNAVLFQDAINTRVPAEMRATTNAIGSLGMRAVFLIFGPLIGHALDSRGPDYAMEILGFIYVIGFFAVAGPLLSQRRHFRSV